MRRDPRVDIKLDIESNVEGVLRAVNAKVDNLLGFFQKVGPEIIYPSLQKSFAAGGRPKWKKLKEGRYKKWKEKNYPGLPILTLTRELSDSLSGPGAPSAIYQPERKSVKVGTSVRHARFHMRNRKCTRKRDFMHLTADDWRKIQSSLRAYIREELKTIKAGVRRRRFT